MVVPPGACRSQYKPSPGEDPSPLPSEILHKPLLVGIRQRRSQLTGVQGTGLRARASAEAQKQALVLSGASLLGCGFEAVELITCKEIKHQAWKYPQGIASYEKWQGEF